MSVHDDLIEVWALIDTPEKWQKGTFGFKGGGRFCAAGAFWTLHTAMRSMEEARHVIEEYLPAGISLIGYNDDPATTHANISAMFSRAIVATEAPTNAQ